MLIRAGYEIAFDAEADTPMIAMLSIHPTRNRDLRSPHRIEVSKPIAAYDYIDAYGNVCTRLVVPKGGVTLSCDFVVQDSGEPDAQSPDADQHPIEALPADIILYLLGSRYCDTDRLSEMAWTKFG